MVWRIGGKVVGAAVEIGSGLEVGENNGVGWRMSLIRQRTWHGAANLPSEWLSRQPVHRDAMVGVGPV